MKRTVAAAIFGGFKRLIQILLKSHFGTCLDTKSEHIQFDLKGQNTKAPIGALDVLSKKFFRVLRRSELRPS